MSLATSRRGGKASADRSKGSSNAKGSHAKGARSGKKAPLKSVRCRTCGSRIRIPDGWTPGPAVRKHYWAKHRDVMLPDREGSQ